MGNYEAYVFSLPCDEARAFARSRRRQQRLIQAASKWTGLVAVAAISLAILQGWHL